MSILITTKTISIIYFILSASQSDNSVFTAFIIIIDIFYPSGEPISLQSLRCSPLAVFHYSFVGHCLAFAAISTRE
jgi:hypothetical protein